MISWERVSVPSASCRSVTVTSCAAAAAGARTSKAARASLSIARLLNDHSNESRGRLAPVGGQGPAAPDGEAAEGEACDGRDDCRETAFDARQGQADEERSGEAGGSDVEFGAHQDRGLASQHVADDAAE